MRVAGISCFRSTSVSWRSSEVRGRPPCGPFCGSVVGGRTSHIHGDPQRSYPLMTQLATPALLLTGLKRGLALLAVATDGSYNMGSDLITRAAALIAVPGTAVVYCADVSRAIVLRPAVALVDDRALVVVTGSVHRYRDRRMPVPGFARGSGNRDKCGAGHGGRALGTGDRCGRRAGPAVGLDCALRAGERPNRSTTGSGRRRREYAAECAGAASEMGQRYRRSCVASGSGTGCPMRGADDLTRCARRSTPADIN